MNIELRAWRCEHTEQSKEQHHNIPLRKLQKMNIELEHGDVSIQNKVKINIIIYRYGNYKKLI